MNEELQPDGDLSPEQQRLVDSLSKEQVHLIDATLLDHCLPRRRKVAMVVALTMGAIGQQFPGIPDIFYSQRIKELVFQGLLESFGNLDYMRYSEIRLPPNSR